MIYTILSKSVKDFTLTLEWSNNQKIEKINSCFQKVTNDFWTIKFLYYKKENKAKKSILTIPTSILKVHRLMNERMNEWMNEWAMQQMNMTDRTIWP